MHKLNTRNRHWRHILHIMYKQSMLENEFMIILYWYEDFTILLKKQSTILQKYIVIKKWIGVNMKYSFVRNL